MKIVCCEKRAIGYLRGGFTYLKPLQNFKLFMRFHTEFKNDIVLYFFKKKDLLTLDPFERTHIAFVEIVKRKPLTKF